MEPSRILPRLAEREGGQSEELAPGDGPERLERHRERRCAHGEAADDRTATRERPHAADRPVDPTQHAPSRGGEGVEPGVGDHHERAEVLMTLDEPEPLHPRLCREKEPVMEDRAAAGARGGGGFGPRETPCPPPPRSSRGEDG